MIQQYRLADGLEIPRILTGLWQIADMEKDGTRVDPVAASSELAAYARASFSGFDMADHYGSAEDIVGELQRRRAAGTVDLGGARPFFATKWCPSPGVMD